MFQPKTLRSTCMFTLGIALLAGCSKQQRAIDDAKKDVLANGQPQEVIYVAANGDTTVTMVSSPAPGGTQPTTVTTTAPAGSREVTGLPDWSNGQHPTPRHVARFTAPGVMVGTPVESEPTAATDPAATPYASTPAGVDAAQNAPPKNFKPETITIPAGTGLAIRINQTINVKHVAPGERFGGSLAESIRRNGEVIIPRGTHFSGVIDAAHKRGHFKGRSILSLRLTSMTYDGKNYPIETASNVSSKKGKGKRSFGLIGGGAGLGMLVGGIATGGVGLAVGGLAGGGLGTLLAGTTGNKDIVLPAESLVRFQLEDDLVVQPAQ